jgi:hypothetical protein
MKATISPGPDAPGALGLCTMANMSAPSEVSDGSIPAPASAPAMAVSTALPPSASTRRPVEEPRGCCEVKTPRRDMTGCMEGFAGSAKRLVRGNPSDGMDTGS